MSSKPQTPPAGDDPTANAQQTSIKLAPAISFAEIIGHELIDEDVWYDLTVHPKPVTVMKQTQAVSFQRKPFQVFRRYCDFQTFVQNLYEEFANNDDMLRQLSNCTGLAFDNEFDQNITNEQRLEDLNVFLNQLFQTSHIVLTSRPVLEFFGRWLTDDNRAKRVESSHASLRRSRSRTRSLVELRAAMKQHAVQLLNGGGGGSSGSSGRPRGKSPLHSRRSSKHTSDLSGILSQRNSMQSLRPTSFNRASGEYDRSSLSLAASDLAIHRHSGMSGSPTEFADGIRSYTASPDTARLHRNSQQTVSSDDNESLTSSKTGVRKSRSLTQIRARVGSLFSRRSSQSHASDSEEARSIRKSRRGSGTSGWSISMSKQISTENDAPMPPVPPQEHYGLPVDFKLPDLNSQQSNELMSDMEAIFQQSNVDQYSPSGFYSVPSSPPPPPTTESYPGDLLFDNHNDYDRFLPSSMARRADTPPSASSLLFSPMSQDSVSASSLSDFLAQATAQRDSIGSVCGVASSGPTNPIGATNLQTRRLSSSNAPCEQDNTSQWLQVGAELRSRSVSPCARSSARSSLSSSLPRFKSPDFHIAAAEHKEIVAQDNRGRRHRRTRSLASERSNPDHAADRTSLRQVLLKREGPQPCDELQSTGQVTDKHIEGNGDETAATSFEAPSTSTPPTATATVVVVEVAGTEHAMRMQLTKDADFMQLRNALWKEVSQTPGMSELMNGRVLIYHDPSNHDASLIRVVDDDSMQKALQGTAEGGSVVLSCMLRADVRRHEEAINTTLAASDAPTADTDEPVTMSSEESALLTAAATFAAESSCRDELRRAQSLRGSLVRGSRSLPVPPVSDHGSVAGQASTANIPLAKLFAAPLPVSSSESKAESHTDSTPEQVVPPSDGSVPDEVKPPSDTPAATKDADPPTSTVCYTSEPSTISTTSSSPPIADQPAKRTLPARKPLPPLPPISRDRVRRTASAHETAILSKPHSSSSSSVSSRRRPKISSTSTSSTAVTSIVARIEAIEAAARASQSEASDDASGDDRGSMHKEAASEESDVDGDNEKVWVPRPASLSARETRSYSRSVLTQLSAQPSTLDDNDSASQHDAQLQLDLPRGALYGNSAISSTAIDACLDSPIPETPMSPPSTTWYRLTQHLDVRRSESNNTADSDDEDNDATDSVATDNKAAVTSNTTVTESAAAVEDDMDDEVAKRLREMLRANKRKSAAATFATRAVATPPATDEELSPRPALPLPPPADNVPVVVASPVSAASTPAAASTEIVEQEAPTAACEQPLPTEVDVHTAALPSPAPTSDSPADDAEDDVPLALLPSKETISPVDDCVEASLQDTPAVEEALPVEAAEVQVQETELEPEPEVETKRESQELPPVPPVQQEVDAQPSPSQPDESPEAEEPAPTAADPAPWMDPDIALRIGVSAKPRSSTIDTAATGTHSAEQAEARPHRNTMSSSTTLSSLLSRKRLDDDNRSLSDAGESTLKSRFQTAASGLVSSLSIRRTPSLSFMRSKASSAAAANSGAKSATDTTAPPLPGPTSGNASDATSPKQPIMPPPRMSSRTNMVQRSGSVAGLQKQSFLEQLRRVQAEEEAKKQAENPLPPLPSDGEASSSASATAAAVAVDSAAPATSSDSNKRVKDGLRKMLTRTESRHLVTKHAPEENSLTIIIQLDDVESIELQVMRTIKYASLRASIWAELISRQMPEALFAGKALVYRTDYSEITVSGDSPLGEAIDDCCGANTGTSQLLFHCV